jgi:membrane protease YdiL (CAAX protease family)
VARVGGNAVLVDRQQLDARRWGPPDEGAPGVGDDEPVGPDDSAFGRIRYGWPGASIVTNPTLRRLQGWELLLVLAIFPLGSVCQGVVDLIERIQTQSPVTSHNVVNVNGPWLVVSITFIEQLGYLAAAGMVCYLLSRSGEGVRSINLGTRRLRMDLALLLPVFVVVEWLPQLLGVHVVAWLHLQGFYLYPSPTSLSMLALTITQIGLSISAGILEEVIVLGYLIRRLEQRGLRVEFVVVIAVAVRVSYHLYYGWNVLPIALWALVSVLVYLRVRRLLPFILCHIAWDAVIPFRAFYPGLYHALTLGALVTTLILLSTWGRWRPPDLDLASPRELPRD